MTTCNIASNTSRDFNYIYQTPSGKIKFDRDTYPFHFLTRFVLTIFGLRDYNLPHIFNTAQKSLSKREIEPLTKKLLKKLNLRQEELTTIQKISDYYANPKNCQYTPAEQQNIKKFIESAQGNLRLNQAIGTLLHMHITIDRVHLNALKMLHTFTYEMGEVKKLNPAFKKIRALQSNLQKNGFLKSPMTEKLSQNEMVKLESVINLAPFFRDLKKMGIQFDRKSTLGTSIRHINATDNTLRRIQNIVRREREPELLSFIFYDFTNFSPRLSPFINNLISMIFRLVFKSHISHASLSYSSSRKQEIEAHMAKKFAEGERSLSSQAYKTLTPNFDLFFQKWPEKTQQQLQNFYGEKWKLVLKQKFHKILKEQLSNSEAFEDLQNPMLRRLLGGLRLKSLFKGGSLETLMKFSNSKRCICTEFVMKVLMRSYAELKDEVAIDLIKAKSRRESDANIEINLPSNISRLHTTKAVSPPGMVRSLIKTGLIKEVPRPEILGEIMTYHKYDLKDGLNLSRLRIF